MPTTKIMAIPLIKSKYSFLCFIVSNIIAVQKYCKTIVLASATICNIIQALTATEKKKATTENARLSPCVDTSYKLSNKFIEDFERIMDFVEHKRIAL